MENTTSTMFYEIFTENRPQIGNLLEQNSHYNFLSKMFDGYDIKNLLLGLYGFECNKQTALYSLPTTEFMDVIYALQILFDKYKITEMCAGLGLFSYMYSKYTQDKKQLEYPETIIHTSDGDRCLETLSPYYYCDMEIISFEKYIIDKNNFCDEICIAIMPPTSIYESLRQFIEICKPNCLVLVIDKDDVNLIVKNVPQEYKTICLNTKIITYLDYHINGKLNIHTCTIVITKTPVFTETIETICKEIVLSSEEVFTSETICETEMIFNDYVMNNLFPKWMLNLSLEEKKKIMESVYKLLCNYQKEIGIKFYKFVSSNIETLEEFWEYLEWKPKPPIYCTKNKYEEYKDIYKYIVDDKPLSELIQRGILPDWVNNKKIALSYIYLEYECQNKRWKTSNEDLISLLEQM